jgi:membrane-bound metal-dependent hydrolase YbcI (DUF457 family)
MYLEHIVYSLAIGIVAVMLLKPREAGWCTFIFVISGCIPDVDGIFDLMRYPPDFTSGLIPTMVEHSRYFHTTGALLMYAILTGIFLARWRSLTFAECVFFAGTGFATHLVEDALVYNPSSAAFWPISAQEVGIGLLPHSRDFFKIANTEVLAIGLVFLILVIVSTVFLKKTGLTRFFRVDRTPGELLFSKEILPVSGKVSPFDDGEGE